MKNEEWETENDFRGGRSMLIHSQFSVLGFSFLIFRRDVLSAHGAQILIHVFGSAMVVAFAIVVGAGSGAASLAGQPVGRALAASQALAGCLSPSG
jgi:dolichol kinase